MNQEDKHFDDLAREIVSERLIKQINELQLTADEDTIANWQISIMGKRVFYTFTGNLPLWSVIGLIIALVQLFFLFFVLANFLPKVYDPSTGGERPLLGSFTSAAIALSLFAGAFNVEIFRSGIEAVPKTMIEACESLGFSRRQCMVQVIFPLALRICLPALNNNLVNLIKTTTLASAIATPELLYYAGQIYADNFATLEVMLLIWVVYVALVGVLVAFMNWWERKLKIPGYGS